MADAFAGFERAEVGGIPVLWRYEDRFKTFRLALHSRRTLDERAAARSLLPTLLLQGTQRDPTRPALARRMENLYGASVAPSSAKLGESHVLRFAIDCVAGEFLPDRPDQFGDSLHFLADFLARPRLESGAFPRVDFERERAQAEHAVRAIHDDKGRYAAMQATERACAGEPMAIPEHGGLDRIAALTPDQPEAARQDFLAHGQMWALAAGALPRDGLLDRIAAFLEELPERRPEPVADPVAVPRRPTTRSVEHATLQQSKLVLVYRTEWLRDPRRWAARGVFASLLGGGPHSRLFREVREKLSLAYYAQATVDRYKGLLFVHVGLDEVAAPQVEAEVGKQLDELRAGRITAEELDTARAVLCSSLTAIDDSLAERLEFTSRQWLLEQSNTPAEQVRLLAEISADEIAAAANDFWLDHAYLLAPGGGEENDG